ncbi:F-box domain-containing protein [Pseudomonas sp. GD03858]|uniref:F-box domain-containing protein n=1 Tax=unclassified Pseudomonas TaxID=196821 RepID=UPI0024480E37|nr:MULTISPECIES: F-box domain-containing protein [unclassified Pseudomonas]MDH0645823.1 F-box domain-containing protein [Pseudomonas sp. GD03867]MDH0663380.1 F-box domain-containing protein [Pseudomonas sp. GD03858]
MLNAIMAGKKRGTGLQGEAFSPEEAEGAEDVITATVFERLAYLPDEQFCAVMHDLLGESFGPLQEIQYWPSWKSRDNTKVEPDLVLHDGRRTVVVEAKRHDHRDQQSPAQLARELLAGWHGEQLEDGCILLALGGLSYPIDSARLRLEDALQRALAGQKASPYRLVCQSWQGLFQILQQHIRPDGPTSCQRLFDDIASCYAWHDLRTHDRRWLKDLRDRPLAGHPDVFAPWRMK